MLGNLCLAAARSLIVLDKLFELLRVELWLGTKLYPTLDRFQPPLLGAFPDQFSLELADRGQNVELQSAINGCRVDPLVHDDQVDILLLQFFDDL